MKVMEVKDFNSMESIDSDVERRFKDMRRDVLPRLKKVVDALQSPNHEGLCRSVGYARDFKGGTGLMSDLNEAYNRHSEQLRPLVRYILGEEDD